MAKLGSRYDPERNIKDTTLLRIRNDFRKKIYIEILTKYYLEEEVFISNSAYYISYGYCLT